MLLELAIASSFATASVAQDRDQIVPMSGSPQAVDARSVRHEGRCGRQPFAVSIDEVGGQLAVTFGARHADLTAAADLRLGAAQSERSRQVVRVDASCPDDSNDLIVGLVISEVSGDAVTWENVRLVLSRDLALADSSARAIPSEDLAAFLE